MDLYGHLPPAWVLTGALNWYLVYMDLSSIINSRLVTIRVWRWHASTLRYLILFLTASDYVPE